MTSCSKFGIHGQVRKERNQQVNTKSEPKWKQGPVNMSNQRKRAKQVRCRRNSKVHSRLDSHGPFAAATQSLFSSAKSLRSVRKKTMSELKLRFDYACHPWKHGTSAQKMNLNKPWLSIYSTHQWEEPSECPKNHPSWYSLPESWQLQHIDEVQKSLPSVSSHLGTCLASFIAKHPRERIPKKSSNSHETCHGFFVVFLGAWGIFKPFKLMVSPQQASRVLPSSAPEVGIAPGAEREPHCRATTFRNLRFWVKSHQRESWEKNQICYNKMRVVCFYDLNWFDDLMLCWIKCNAATPELHSENQTEWRFILFNNDQYLTRPASMESDLGRGRGFNGRRCLG